MSDASISKRRSGLILLLTGCTWLVFAGPLAVYAGADVICPKVAAPPVIDGALGDAAWPPTAQQARFDEKNQLTPQSYEG
ncbi:MAG: hypothetical protein V2A34_15110 [Lentisphaerota bacterium]